MIETRSVPTSLAATHRGFAFYVALPKKLHSLHRELFYVAGPISSIGAALLLKLTHVLPLI